MAGAGAGAGGVAVAGAGARAGAGAGTGAGGLAGVFSLPAVENCVGVTTGDVMLGTALIAFGEVRCSIASSATIASSNRFSATG